ncbi:hypothetical protein QKT49_gp026 [Acanthamoeba castellanii medusavirus]|uniref:Uncharacterized protein n=1 Tax=Acanthamoeba castellanii medusavirus J1 TaxID=3114988 RepID=A0A3T1CWG0_9VIRU|nr:hypothetical protein QKT49_gp026 [Acanthamoeba castellanii medusavirus]BBI30166.1 hypothetical protein [Acanthamoeba castellanii medusavirus J1]
MRHTTIDTSSASNDSHARKRPPSTEDLKRKAIASLCVKHYAEQTAMLARHIREQRELEEYLNRIT